MASQTRRKVFSRRSRTGCRTCRRIKCDETPGSCRNCATAGWKCEGYDVVRLVPPGKGQGSDTSLTLYQPSQICPGESPEERRGFAFFMTVTVPNMTGFFDSCLWENLILPMSHSERAVVHAVVALAALHEDLQSRGAPLSRENLANRRQKFALGQYGRSLTALNERRYSQDPKLRDVILACCLLFVTIDVLRGQYDSALLHLKHGLASIEEERQISSGGSGFTTCRTAVKQSLLATMTRLETQSLFFGLDPLISATLSFSVNNSGGSYFKTLQEARRALDKLLASSVRLFMAVYELPARARVANLHPDLADTQNDLMAQLHEFAQQLDWSMTHSLRLEGPKERRGLDMVLLHHITFSILVEISLCVEQPSYHDRYLNSFQRMMALSREISQSFKNENGSGTKPTLLLDMGIIPSLFLICWKCRDSNLKHQALDALEEWPHREGLWDSRLLTIFARQIIQLEKETASDDPDAWSQIQDHSLEVSDDQSYAILKYQTYGPGKGARKQRRVIPLDEET
ncbi:hypothetical protein PMG11_03586 [Penicillium brasilianum]|uniref:Zn(2)-C6 fungal-type domain-containing protein n=1 Tax=Penicillium brasilianum TaxID=104259 RepID=A0A0F7VG04_PENBI|nr:hypothetical protein PMG11_03586 [Penicillium brasilianum]